MFVNTVLDIITAYIALQDNLHFVNTLVYAKERQIVIYNVCNWCEMRVKTMHVFL